MLLARLLFLLLFSADTWSDSDVRCKTSFLALDPYQGGITRTLIHQGALIVQCYCHAIPSVKIKVQPANEFYRQNKNKSRPGSTSKSTTTRTTAKTTTERTTGMPTRKKTTKARTVRAVHDQTTIDASKIRIGYFKNDKIYKMACNQRTLVEKEGWSQFRIQMTENCLSDDPKPIVCHYNNLVTSIPKSSLLISMEISKWNLCGKLEEQECSDDHMCPTNLPYAMLPPVYHNKWVLSNRTVITSDCGGFRDAYGNRNDRATVEYSVQSDDAIQLGVLPHLEIGRNDSKFNFQRLGLYQSYVIQPASQLIRPMAGEKCPEERVKVQMEYSHMDKWTQIKGSCKTGWTIPVESLTEWKHRILITIHGPESQIARLGFSVVAHEISPHLDSQGNCAEPSKCRAPPELKDSVIPEINETDITCSVENPETVYSCFPSKTTEPFNRTSGTCKRKKVIVNLYESDRIAGYVLMALWLGMFAVLSALAFQRYYPMLFQLWRPIVKDYHPEDEWYYLMWGPFKELPPNYEKATSMDIHQGSYADQIQASRQMAHFSKKTTERKNAMTSTSKNPPLAVTGVQIIHTPTRYPQPTLMSVYIPRLHLPRSPLTEKQQTEYLKIEHLLFCCQEKGIPLPRGSQDNLMRCQLPEYSSILASLESGDLSVLTGLTGGLETIMQISEQLSSEIPLSSNLAQSSNIGHSKSKSNSPTLNKHTGQISPGKSSAKTQKSEESPKKKHNDRSTPTLEKMPEGSQGTPKISKTGSGEPNSSHPGNEDAENIASNAAHAPAPANR